MELFTELRRATAAKEEVWIPAGAFTPRITNGPADNFAETATNHIGRRSLDFDPSTAEFAQAMVRMPKRWNEGTLTFRAVWSHPSTTTNFGVVWKLAALALSDDDAMEAALGTVQTSIDAGGTTDDLYISPESSAITAAGAPAEGDVLVLEISRDPAHASDTMAVDARLHGVVVCIWTDALQDT